MGHLSYAYLSNDTVGSPDKLTNTAILLVTREFHTAIDSKHCINKYIYARDSITVVKKLTALTNRLKLT
jgi:hypothetical protein